MSNQTRKPNVKVKKQVRDQYIKKYAELNFRIGDQLLKKFPNSKTPEITYEQAENIAKQHEEKVFNQHGHDVQSYTNFFERQLQDKEHFFKETISLKVEEMVDRMQVELPTFEKTLENLKMVSKDRTQIEEIIRYIRSLNRENPLDSVPKFYFLKFLRLRTCLLKGQKNPVPLNPTPVNPSSISPNLMNSSLVSPVSVSPCLMNPSEDVQDAHQKLMIMKQKLNEISTEPHHQQDYPTEIVTLSQIVQTFSHKDISFHEASNIRQFYEQTFVPFFQTSGLLLQMKESVIQLKIEREKNYQNVLNSIPFANEYIEIIEKSFIQMQPNSAEKVQYAFKSMFPIVNEFLLRQKASLSEIEIWITSPALKRLVIPPELISKQESGSDRKTLTKEDRILMVREMVASMKATNNFYNVSY